MGVSISSEAVLNEDEKDEWEAQHSRLIPIPPYKSKLFSPNDNIPGQGWHTFDLLQKGMRLDISAINTLYSLFCIADADGGHTIDEKEFYGFLKLPKTPFHDKMFRLFDTNGNNEIDFQEFVCSIWNLCTWTENKLPTLMFNLYDSDSSGFLDLKECKTLISDVFYNRKNKSVRDLLLTTLEEITVPGIYANDWRIYHDSFVEWSQVYTDSWQPVRCMQALVRAKILGPEWWDKIGVRARKQMIEDLIEHSKEEVGTSGAKQACQEIINFQEERAMKEARKERQEKLWAQAAGKTIENDEKESGSDSDSETLNLKVRSIQEEMIQEVNRDLDEAEPSLEMARKKVKDSIEGNCKIVKRRVKAVETLRKKRHENAKRWMNVYKTAIARSDPVSFMLRFEDRTFGKSLLDNFQKDWVEAKRDLENKNYNRGERLEEYNNKPDKSFVHFQRKSVLEIRKSLRTKSVTSVAQGKTPPGIARAQVKRHQEEAVKAAGKEHLAQRHDEEIDSESESVSDGNIEYDIGSENKYDSLRYKGPDALAMRKGFKGQYTGQNHKMVPEEYRENKVNREIMIKRAKRQGKPTTKYIYARRSFTSMPSMKDQRNFRRSVKWCAVDMITEID